jgi:hypothetical protein
MEKNVEAQGRVVLDIQDLKDLKVSHENIENDAAGGACFDDYGNYIPCPSTVMCPR